MQLNLHFKSLYCRCIFFTAKIIGAEDTSTSYLQWCLSDPKTSPLTLLHPASTLRSVAQGCSFSQAILIQFPEGRPSGSPCSPDKSTPLTQKNGHDLVTEQQPIFKTFQTGYASIHPVFNLFIKAFCFFKVPYRYSRQLNKINVFSTQLVSCGGEMDQGCSSPREHVARFLSPILASSASAHFILVSPLTPLLLTTFLRHQVPTSS